MSKTALVTGSSRGIGKACALKLAELGYDIAVNCNSNLEMAQKAVDEITSLGRKAVAYKANTADIDEVRICSAVFSRTSAELMCLSTTQVWLTTLTFDD